MQFSIAFHAAALLFAASSVSASTDGKGNWWGVCLSNGGSDRPWGECYYDSDNLNQLDGKLETACGSDSPVSISTQHLALHEMTGLTIHLQCPQAGDGTPCYHDTNFGATVCSGITAGQVP